MLRQTVLCLALIVVAALPLRAQSVAELGDALRLDDVIGVMRDEGLVHGGDLEAELFPGSGGVRWQAMVGAIYDADEMRAGFDALFVPQISADPEALAQAVEFFASDRGRRIAALEVEARRALLDDAVEDAARARLDRMRREADPRLDLITRFVEANDLIERNVSGALNASFGFYRGLFSAGGAFEGMSEADMLAEVWSQEGQIRTETEEWLYPYLALAYQPLSDDDLRAYVAYSESASGRTLNAAIFAGFDRVFSSISEKLGAAAAKLMAGEDL